MLLSICIPTFNRSEKLDNCLNSILISIQNARREILKFVYRIIAQVITLKKL